MKKVRPGSSILCKHEHPLYFIVSLENIKNKMMSIIDEKGSKWKKLHFGLWSTLLIAIFTKSAWKMILIIEMNCPNCHKANY